MELRHLRQSDLGRLAGIDRSDYSDTWCVVRGGVVCQEKREFRHVGFSQEHWRKMAEEWGESLRRGDILLVGAFDGGDPVGVAGLETDRRYGWNRNMYNFGPIWVSREYRGRGIGKRLFLMVLKEAEELDVDALYVSATPVPGTVGFYMSMGCRLLKSPDPELYRQEPEDIHMYLSLSAEGSGEPGSCGEMGQ